MCVILSLTMLGMFFDFEGVVVSTDPHSLERFFFTVHLNSVSSLKKRGKNGESLTEDLICQFETSNSSCCGKIFVKLPLGYLKSNHFGIVETNTIKY